MSVDEIKNRLRSGDVAGAETAAKELLAAEPDNMQAKMLYGTCRHLQGDEATFRRIHDELAPKMANERNEKTLSLWRRYHTLWMSLIVGGLVLAGVVVGVAYLGKDIMNMLGVSSHVGDVCVPAMTTRDQDFQGTLKLYGGPPREDLQIGE